MNKIVLLDTNIFHNMAINQNCMNEVLGLLNNDTIIIADITIYELTNKAVCLKRIVSNNNIKICRINCLGNGLSDNDINLIKNQIIENGNIDTIMYETMKKNYLSMLHPIICILLYKYIGFIGPLINKNEQTKFAKELISKKTIRKIKRYSYSILDNVNPKEVKIMISSYVKKMWKKFIYMYHFEDENKLIKFKKALDEQKLRDFLGFNAHSKKGSEMINIINNHYDKYTYPIIESKYNDKMSSYIKFLFVKSIVEQLNIDINSLFDALLISSLAYEVVLCTDDVKMNQFIHSVGKYDEICNSVRAIKQKYD